MGKLDAGVTFVANNTRLVGDIRFKDTLQVNGIVEGRVFSDDDSASLIVNRGATIRGEVRVAQVVVDGTVEGDIHASGRVHLTNKARVCGDVYYKLVEMQRGAIVNGRLHTVDSVTEEAPSTALRLQANGEDVDG
ncbi:MAG: polymer-forming cytoskeletal protein [Gammaproteobacteria bacterium]|nr:polymer-forming cytoskeletal protein [Gammaproteobacteria bacterium]